jgi:HPt (histidine-containing phosphotransfer) domain-containing protein/HAMP domain-containing protein
MIRSPLTKSIPARVASLVTAVVVVMAGITGLAAYFRAIADAEQFLVRKGHAYAVLAARELAPAIAFEDTETAREVLDAIALDPDVLEASLYRADGSLVETRTGAGAPPTAQRWGSEARAPVVPREGGRGEVVVRLSASSLATARARAIRASLAAAGVTLALGIAGALVIGASLRRRLRDLTEVAAAIVHGDHRRRPGRTGSGDEIDQLSGAFGTMLGHLEDLRREQARDAACEQERLDDLVRERTRELEGRHREVLLLLDHMSDGVITIDRAGNLGSEGSRILETWFGPVSAGEKLWRYLGASDESLALRLEMGWESVESDFLPLELSLEQLPRRFRVGAATYELRVAPIDSGSETPDRFLIVVRDVTLALERDAAADDVQELGSALEQVARDREGFLDQLRETDALARRVAAATDPRPEVLRDLHTLKGNAAMLGFRSVAAICHEWESRTEDTQELPTGELRSRLMDRWDAVRGSLAPLFVDGSARAGVDRVDLARLVDAIRAGRPRQVLLALSRALTMERAEGHLTRLAEYARTTARARGRRVEVTVACDDVRVQTSAFAPLWTSLVHVVRNALTHGIESTEERDLAGKRVEGAIRLACSEGPGGVTIAVSDDGRGIDWGSVRAAAERRGMAATSQRDLEAALLTDGFTTCEIASEMAGRGQGMAAVLAAVRDLGATLHLQSLVGGGTTWSIVVPCGSPWLRPTPVAGSPLLSPSHALSEAS